MCSINDSCMRRYCYYCSYTRAVSCCWDKMCFVCLSYLLGTIHEDGDGMHDADTRLVVHNGMMAHGGCDCRNRHEMCGDRLGKALHS